MTFAPPKDPSERVERQASAHWYLLVGGEVLELAVVHDGRRGAQLDVAQRGAHGRLRAQRGEPAPHVAQRRAQRRVQHVLHTHTHSLTHRRHPRGGDASAEPYIKRRVARIYELRLSPTRRRRRDAKPEKQISETDDGVDRYRP